MTSCCSSVKSGGGRNDGEDDSVDTSSGRRLDDHVGNEQGDGEYEVIRGTYGTAQTWLQRQT